MIDGEREREREEVVVGVYANKAFFLSFFLSGWRELMWIRNGVGWVRIEPGLFFLTDDDGVREIVRRLGMFLEFWERVGGNVVADAFEYLF